MNWRCQKACLPYQVQTPHCQTSIIPVLVLQLVFVEGIVVHLRQLWHPMVYSATPSWARAGIPVQGLHMQKIRNTHTVIHAPIMK